MGALGRHILVEFWGCTPEIMNDVMVIEGGIITNFCTENRLRYYNADIHTATFCLPIYAKTMLNGKR